MPQKTWRTLTDRSLNLLSGIVLILAVLLPQVAPSSVFAGTLLNNRQAKLETSVPGATGNVLIAFTITDMAQTIGSFRFEFCENDPIPNTACTVPAGLDITNPTITEQAGENGFTLHPNSDANNIIMGRVPSVPVEENVFYEFDDLTNPLAVGSFYIRLYSYSSDDGTGVNIQEGGIALSTNRQIDVSTEVPPYLRFCAGVTISGFDCSSATSFLINLGEFSTNTSRSATSQMLAATNAANGYTITLSGTTLTSGNNIINNNAVPAGSSTGTNQFGINLRSNGNPGVGAEPVGPGTATPFNGYQIPNQYKFVPGDAVVTSPVPSDNRKFTVSYITNISGSQPPGFYATSVSFICLANF